MINAYETSGNSPTVILEDRPPNSADYGTLDIDPKRFPHRCKGCWYCGTPIFDMRIIGGDAYECTFAEVPVGFERRQTDHQTPRSRGGKGLSDNLVDCCVHCNSKKGTRTLEEYRTYCGDLVFFGEVCNDRT